MKRLHFSGKRSWMLAAALATLVPAWADAAGVERPKLVVGLVVDQMRWDYLVRYADRYGEGGFKRLLSEGYSCDNAMIDYLPSVTAVGHTAIYTGSVPALTGIAGNNFRISPTGERTYCTTDTTVQSVGTSSDAGRMSPRNLLATTLCDELRLATNFRSKVIGVAIKDRTAILPAGHAANGAYWMDSKANRFITSTYYRNELPGWVKDFNRRLAKIKYTDAGWQWLYDRKSYVQSTTDDSRYGLSLGNDLRNSYVGNTVTLDLAKAALEGEKLGQGEATDLLAVSLSSTDYAGHRLGPNAAHIEDMYLHLDRDLADFLTFLDQKVGRGRYLLFLTADHGANHAERFLSDSHLPGGLFDGEALRRDLDSISARMGISGSVVERIENYQVFLNNKRIRRQGLPADAIRRAFVSYLQEQPGVAYALDLKSVPAYLPERLRQMVANGYHVKRSGDIQLLPESGWSESYDAAQPGKGTDHGTWANYDTHIPLVFFGWHVHHGADSTPRHLTDVAPTVASMLGIQMPSASVGTPIALP